MRDSLTRDSLTQDRTSPSPVTTPQTPVAATLHQRSFDELGTPLHDATFCVIDFETTGGSPTECSITEVGAVKVRGGEVLGTFQTLVNPGSAIPPNITMITGITDQLVMRAPEMATVLPSLLEFIGGSVIVAHNLRFDMGFLKNAIHRHGGPMIGNSQLDTLALSRRLLAGEVPNHKLGDLARRLRLPHQPTHRALEDAWTTVDLLHYLIERATAWGVTGLDDLLALPTIAGHPQWKKLKLTTTLPRSPGIYQFHDRDNRILYVGKATDLRARVRSYFSSDQRRKVAQLLRETDRITHQECRNTLEAEVLELRLIHEHQPRFNKRGRRPIRPCYVRLTTNERFPRLTIAKKPTGEGITLGPLPNRKEAAAVIEAIQTAMPIRRCNTRIGRNYVPREALCTAAQLGIAMCPCSGAISEAEYSEVVSLVAQALSGNPELVLERLERRMFDLATDERFEEAASVRNEAATFARAVGRQRRLMMLDDLHGLVLETKAGARVELGPGGRLPGELATSLDEALCVASWLERHADSVRLVATDGKLASTFPGLPNFKAREKTAA